MPAPRIAVLGTFDVDNYGDHLFPRVAAQELMRRHPDALVDAWSPYGWLHPTPLDGGRPASPLGRWSPERAAALADAYDLVLVGGGEILHLNDPLLAAVYGTTPAELEWLAPTGFFLGEGMPRGAVAWNGVGAPLEADPGQADRLRQAFTDSAYLAVRDTASAQRLRGAGVADEITVVPDSALLVHRILPAATLAAHRDRLRAEGSYPPNGAPLVVQGCDLLVPSAGELGAGIRRWLGARGVVRDIVLLETGRCRGDALFADAIAPRLAPHRTWRLPPSATVEEIAAALEGAAAFVGSSLHGSITALVYGRPFVVVNIAREAKLDGFTEMIGLPDRLIHAAADLHGALDRAGPVPDDLLAALQRRVDAHFDRIAAVAGVAALAAPNHRPQRPALEQAAVAELVAWLRASGRAGEAERRAELAEARLAAAGNLRRRRTPKGLRVARWATRRRRAR